MRPKQEIEGEITKDLPEDSDFEMSGLRNQALIIELLLDIRALLSPRGPQTVHPPSAPPPVLDMKGRTG